MKIVSNKNRKITKHQQGGMVAGPEAAPAPAQGGQDQMQMLVEAAMTALESQDANLAMQVCQMLLELVGAAPAPVGAPQGGGNAPVFKRGGKIARYTSPLDKFRK